MSARPLEIKAVAKLLQKDWDSPEALAKALIEELDRVRADRTSYVAVMQFGDDGSIFYAGLGPYPGAKSAQQAMAYHPSAGMATKRAVVPMMNADGLKQHLKKVG
jgi:hypothetical protein